MKMYKALLFVFAVTSVIIIPGTNIAKEDQLHKYRFDNLLQSAKLPIPIPVPTPTPVYTDTATPGTSQNKEIKYCVENADGTKQFLIILPAPNMKDDIFMNPPIVNDDATITPVK